MTKSIIIIDDDNRLTSVLARRFNATGNYTATTFSQASEALAARPGRCYAIFLDMMMGDELGLDFITELKRHYQPEHLIIMTGYASIATTVTAMKRGATDYLAKPASFSELLGKLGTETIAQSVPAPTMLTVAQAEWEHIQRVLAENEGNITRTAQALGMHRRSLQRKLQKYSPTKK
ncbi:response regulator transcription factor [Alteromonas lipolytica]|uniref:Two-component system response regulator n=1 Tax=Alteromonas lipolytica TaxID=1856405 RepID=A0A1E8FFX1_9ALTE|nr:response regulator [Alteromonas lipolytica]OFI34842.1 two-component system response regulator [Alteromonas lipolytica]GGF54426.1 DNA-binding response regulator [Alteromonas lipolytica]